MEDKLVVLSEIETRLAAVESIDEAKDIRDKAEALRVYAKSAKHGLGIQNRAAAIKILAEQRAGALLAKVERAQGKDGAGLRSTLERSEIPVVVAHRWQRMAEIPAEKVRECEARMTEDREELTSAYIYRLASGGVHVAHNAGESEWYTPAEIIELARGVLGEIDLDPATHADAQAKIRATRHFTAADDGLANTWQGRVWLNPPYSQPVVGRFCEKLLEEIGAGRVNTAITLTNNATETEWGQLLLGACNAACFPKGRVKFWAPDRESASPLQGQMLCYFGDAPERFADAFQTLGVCLSRTS